jgi:hypothetical protein
MNIYYIYFYLRSDYTPYYVGKGKEKRAWEKGKGEIRPPKDKSKIILVEQELSELLAFILERYYIRWFGRKDNNTGILRNKTDGGEGVSGIQISDKERKRRSEFAKKHQPLNTKENNENTRIRMSQNNPMKKGMTNPGSFKPGNRPVITKERNLKISISKQGSKNPQYKNPNAAKYMHDAKATCCVCGLTTNKGNISRWHNQHCKHNQKNISD